MRQRCRGFTLLELMIVIVLIGVLLGMVSFAAGPIRRVRRGRRRTSLRRLIQQLA